MTDRELPIPSLLNTGLVAGVAGALLGLALLAPRVEGWALVVVVVTYTALFQTAYSLFHEAAHRKLHADPRWNRALGAVVGSIFGMSVTMYGISHWSHHLKNRSPSESFDQIGPGERWLPKALAWYGMLVSLWYWVILAANLAILVAPSTVGRAARRAKFAERVFEQPPAVLGAIRVELVVWLVLAAVMSWWVGPRLLILQAVAAWWWSSTNYVEHAYSPRDVLLGAFNLRAPALYGWLNLHRELDRTHHVWPDASWIHLPRLTTERDGHFAAHWVRQWRGPVRSEERGPDPLDTIPPTPVPAP